jgi:elongation factor Tu
LGRLTTQDESATFNWPEGSEELASDKMVLPGDNVEMQVSLLHPLALEKGQRFNVRESGRTVATGLVTKIIE